MTNKEHLEIIRQGIDAWNQWREDNPNIRPDLSGADLSGADLSGALLVKADLSRADLSRADLLQADLTIANIRGANFREAELSAALLISADLREVNFREANLIATNFSGALLVKADFRKANLNRANLSETDLSGVDFTEATLGWTVFGDCNLRMAQGLDTIIHQAPSSIGLNTLQRSAGNIAKAFLKGCGLSDWEIEFTKVYQKRPSQEIGDILYDVHNLRLGQPIQINPLFISYSHADSTFVDAMEEHLDQRGIRFWRDIHDATAGRIEKQIDRAIRHNPTVLLVLSRHSVKSDWVQDEVWLAHELEIKTGRDVLCPVTLDDAWRTCNWPRRLRRQIEEYYILPFHNWKDEDAFEETLTKLIDGLVECTDILTLS